jgi:hypothetical protein
MVEWLPIVFVAFSTIVVWKWAPSPTNWILSGLSWFFCLVSSYTLLKGDRTRSAILIGFGFIIVGLMPVYDWGIRPILPSSHLWQAYGLLCCSLLVVILAPVLGLAVSKMLLSPAWRILGIAVAVAPAILGIIGGIGYWLLFILIGPASWGSAHQQRVIALIAMPSLLNLGLWMGIALHRAWFGLLDAS